MTLYELYLLSEIRSSLERICEYCEERSFYSDGERDRLEYVSMIARDGIREAIELEEGGAK